MNNRLIYKVVDFSNALEAIDTQRSIFPEDGLLNILCSLDRDLFIRETSLLYPDDHVKYYLAYLDGDPIGITGLYYYPEHTEEMWLAWFGVKKDYRGQGFASEILKWSIEQALKSNRKVMRLYTDTVENADAIKLYEKTGFIGVKYTAEKLDYDCHIFSKNLADEDLPWIQRNLGLGQQSGFERIDDDFKENLLNKYKESYLVK